MSRVGVKTIAVPAGVTVQVSGQNVSVSGPKGKSAWQCPTNAKVVFDDKSKIVRVDRMGEDKQARANHGLTRSLIANMIRGASEGFSRRLQIYGTGYNCKLEGKTLHLNVGYSGRGDGKPSQFQIPVPTGIEVVVETPAARGDNEPAQLVVKGSDKQQVGEFAARIRKLRKTEPYKGKGIRYEGEYVRRKQGKALTGGG
jgi:large subunit ribosomal protein L6